jgi:hypothetical protein
MDQVGNWNDMDRERHQAFVKEQESSEVAEFDKSQIYDIRKIETTADSLTVYSQEPKEHCNTECDCEVSR